MSLFTIDRITFLMQYAISECLSAVKKSDLRSAGLSSSSSQSYCESGTGTGEGGEMTSQQREGGGKGSGGKSHGK
jgi:hypothetical protein